jgi:hypothetical protein
LTSGLLTGGLVIGWLAIGWLSTDGGGISTASATSFWFTGSATSAAPGPSTLAQTHCGDPAALPPIELFLWARPDAGQTLSNVSLNVTSSDATILDFHQVLLHEPSPSGLPRFEYKFDSAGASGLPTVPIQTSPADRIDGFQGFTVDTNAAVGLNPGNADDVLLVPAAWLLGTIEVVATATGSTDLFLQLGDNGLNNLGETALVQSVTLGRSDDVTYLGSDLAHRGITLTGDSADAQITIHASAADFNLDGVVDGDDFAVWEQNLGTVAGGDCLAGDADSDGDVDGTDALLWQGQFDPTRAPAAAVPAPSSWALGVLASAGWAARSRRGKGPVLAEVN